MLRPGFLVCSALALILSLPAALVAQGFYRPKPLPSLDAALEQLQALSPHFAPGNLVKYTVQLTRGYSLSRIELSQQDLKLYFSQAPAQRIEYYLMWRKGASAPAYDPYTGDIVTDIVFAKSNQFWVALAAMGNVSYPAPWCVVPYPIETDSRPIVCMSTEAELYQFTDLLATLIIASGGQVYPRTGFGKVDPVR